MSKSEMVKSFNVHAVLKKDGFTEEQIALALEHFARIYCVEDHTKGDAHGTYARACGVGRDEAKTLCYRMMYSHRSYMSAKWHHDRAIMLALAREIRSSTGESISAILDRIEESLR